MQASSIDNDGLRVIEDINLESTDETIYTVQFNYDFNDTDNNFRQNQTVCMSMPSL